MLSDLLTFVLALAVCGMAVLCVYCYRLGLRTAASRGETAKRGGDCLCETGRRRKESVSERGFCTAERGRTGAGRPRHGGPRDGEAPRAEAAGSRGGFAQQTAAGHAAAPAGAEGWRADK
ncbi:MAG: hypothetical protein ACLSBB_16345 [Ruthenibacterium lactatiformans]